MRANIVRVPKPATAMQDDELGHYCADGLVGIVRRVGELKPYFVDLWRRFDAGHTILGCRTRTEYCDKVLNCCIRRVQQIIYGRTPQKTTKTNRDDRTLNLFDPTENKDYKPSVSDETFKWTYNWIQIPLEVDVFERLDVYAGNRKMKIYDAAIQLLKKALDIERDSLEHGASAVGMETIQ
jgi:hypothetical protein